MPEPTPELSPTPEVSAIESEPSGSDRSVAEQAARYLTEMAVARRESRMPDKLLLALTRRNDQSMSYRAQESSHDYRSSEKAGRARF